MERIYTRDNERVSAALTHFPACGKLLSYSRITQGHINDTFRVDCENGTYLLQKVSSVAFKEPLKVMKNIDEVTRFLRGKIIESGGNPDKETLNLVPSENGLPYYLNEKGQVWRVYLFIDGVGYDAPKSTEQFAKAAIAFGRFQHLLAQYPAQNLEETIPNFHNTPKRYQTFLEACENNLSGRKENCLDLIALAKARADRIHAIVDGLNDGTIPLRTTHNDTKLNNIMFDEEGQEPLCVLDLDTIMPGSALYDFGDSIRFGANTACEDERDLSKIHFDFERFKAYARGFIEGADGSLTENEIRLFPYGAWLMTYECAIRFLTDYLDGDRYFRVESEDHNLVRAHDQFALLLDMERQAEAAQAYVETLLPSAKR